MWIAVVFLKQFQQLHPLHLWSAILHWSAMTWYIYNCAVSQNTLSIVHFTDTKLKPGRRRKEKLHKKVLLHFLGEVTTWNSTSMLLSLTGISLFLGVFPGSAIWHIGILDYNWTQDAVAMRNAIDIVSQMKFNRSFLNIFVVLFCSQRIQWTSQSPYTWATAPYLLFAWPQQWLCGPFHLTLTFSRVPLSSNLLVSLQLHK